jgi:hypothetical protein
LNSTAENTSFGDDCNAETLWRSIAIGMRIKRIFAGSIVALLLSVSPLAAACDLSCAFARADSDCHRQKLETEDPASGGMKMDGMTMVGMSMPDTDATADPLASFTSSRENANHPSIGEMGPCERQNCDSGSAVFARSSRSVASGRHLFLAVTGKFRVREMQIPFHDARDDVATYPMRGGNLLPLTLRI